MRSLHWIDQTERPQALLNAGFAVAKGTVGDNNWTHVPTGLNSTISQHRDQGRVNIPILPHRSLTH